MQIQNVPQWHLDQSRERYLFDVLLIQLVKQLLKGFTINKTIREFLCSLRNEMGKLLK